MFACPDKIHFVSVYTRVSDFSKGFTMIIYLDIYLMVPVCVYVFLCVTFSSFCSGPNVFFFSLIAVCLFFLLSFIIRRTTCEFALVFVCYDLFFSNLMFIAFHLFRSLFRWHLFITYFFSLQIHNVELISSSYWYDLLYLLVAVVETSSRR